MKEGIDACEREVGGRTNLNAGNVTLRSKIHPVGFVELGPDEVVEIRDPIVLSHERSWREERRGRSARAPRLSFVTLELEDELTGQSQLSMSLNRTDGSPEDVGGSDVDLVEQEESPFSRREEVHHLR